MKISEKEYVVEFFSGQNYVRRKCSKCGSAYWTLDPQRSTCGDPPCDEYSFIGDPAFKKKYSLSEMRESYLSFFEKKQHERVEPYPVVARWRDDVFFTQASIYDFQPWVISRVVEPPANPLTISQPCLRFNDMDNVGKTGRHHTLFEMMAHHVFNFPEKNIYFKNRTVELSFELLKSLGVSPEDIVYKEAWWEGGGNAGPCFEVLVRGVELATLVFMQYEKKTGAYHEMDTKVVDTGYGLERFVWASAGTPTTYDAVFPKVLEKLEKEVGLARPDHSVMKQYSTTAGMMNVNDVGDLRKLRQKAAEKLGMDVEKLVEEVRPYENIYAATEHAKALAFMLSDGVVPSNVREGYFARLLIRKSLRYMKNTGLKLPLSQIVAWQVSLLKEFPHLGQAKDDVVKIVDHEEEKYAQTKRRGKALVEKTCSELSKKNQKQIPLETLTTLYDTHGMTPEDVKDFSELQVVVPDDFYARVSEKHEEVEREEEKTYSVPKNIPPTRLLFYEDAYMKKTKAKVLYVDKNLLVLDKTVFYPESGGQMPDEGTIMGKKVVDVQKNANTVVHVLENTRGIKKGQTVDCEINWDTRIQHMRHHTATHLVNGAAKNVLGKHAWQCGALKDKYRARLDLTHYKRVTEKELEEIEKEANDAVTRNMNVDISWMDRNEAEKKYGMVLYQGGVVPGKNVRVLSVEDYDVEACGGTHVSKTGEIGFIKIMRSERIQDGVERLVFSAGKAAVDWVQKKMRLLNQSAENLSVPPEQLDKATKRFFEEWKQQQKEIEKLRANVAQVVASDIAPKTNKEGLKVVCELLSSVGDMKELSETVEDLSKNSDIVLLASGGEAGMVAAKCSRKAVEKGYDAAKLANAVAVKMGGRAGGSTREAKGGGPKTENLEKVLKETSAKLNVV